jgi:hypothetical protein
MTEHDPRPEFDHVQHNKPNPILLATRDYAAHSGDLRAEAYAVLGALGAWPQGLTWRATPDQVDHARRVLTLILSTKATAA